VSIRVLVVDDSNFIRRAVTRMLGADPAVSAVESAAHGLEALGKLRDFEPDVVTLDLNMPEVDGLETLRRIMIERPTPVVLLSSYAQSSAARTVEALAAGAVDFVDKSTVGVMDVHSLAGELTRKVKAAASGRVGARAEPKQAGGSPAALATTRRPGAFVIGASTGGPAALQRIFSALPKALAVPVLVVQHMPAGFTGAFAERLDARSPLSVREAETGDRLARGHVLLARGGKNMGLRRTARGPEIILSGGPRRSVHVPSLDFTAQAAAEEIGRGTCLVVLTGMGTDGLEGARAVRAAGGTVITQAERGCVLYGMPRAVVRAGLATATVALDDMAETITRMAELPP
jgi:two-component system chemotaxis response regulator CheB